MALQATKSDEDAWEGGLQPALPSVFNRAGCDEVWLVLKSLLSSWGAERRAKPDGRLKAKPSVGIPAKLNACSEGKSNGIPG